MGFSIVKAPLVNSVIYSVIVFIIYIIAGWIYFLNGFRQIRDLKYDVGTFRAPFMSMVALCSIFATGSVFIWHNILLAIGWIPIVAYIVPPLIPLLLFLVAVHEEKDKITAQLSDYTTKVVEHERMCKRWKLIKWGLFSILIIAAGLLMFTRGGKLSISDAISEMGPSDLLVLILSLIFLTIFEIFLIFLSGNFTRAWWKCRELDRHSSNRILKMEQRMKELLHTNESIRLDQAISEKINLLIKELSTYLDKVLKRRHEDTPSFDIKSLAMGVARARHLNWDGARQLVINELDNKIKFLQSMQSPNQSLIHYLQEKKNTINTLELPTNKDVLFDISLEVFALEWFQNFT